jgi:hypothetical protein
MALSDRVLTRFTRVPGVLSLWHRFPVGSLDIRTRYGISPRPPYAYGVFAAADLAKRLGLEAISVIEAGVAGGRGLLALENIAADVSHHFGIRIAVFGFDSGSGMPDAVDFRDLPHVWKKGFYTMDAAGLKAKLRQATLIIGDVTGAIPRFLENGGFPPVGFVAFDLDYYSSTKNAFRLFDGSHDSRLPRVWCYFDDIMWPDFACHNEFTGELCAIREYNLEHAHSKLCPIHMFRHTRPVPAAWHEQIYVLHDFSHPLYCVNIMPEGPAQTQKTL